MFCLLWILVLLVLINPHNNQDVNDSEVRGLALR
jgi:hypothetical protein